MSIENAIVDFFAKKAHVISVDLFGCCADGRQNESSDIDIAVLYYPENVPSILEQIAWKEELSSILNKDIDLICLNNSSPIIGMQVNKNGKKIIMNNSHSYYNYEMR